MAVACAECAPVVSFPASVENRPVESAVTAASGVSSTLTTTVAPASAVPSIRTGFRTVPVVSAVENTGVAVRVLTWSVDVPAADGFCEMSVCTALSV